MSRTDKTAPWWVREQRGEITENIKGSKKSWREKGSGPKGVRTAKREAGRARRHGVTDPRMLISLRVTYKYNSG